MCSKIQAVLKHCIALCSFYAKLYKTIITLETIVEKVNPKSRKEMPVILGASLEGDKQIHSRNNFVSEKRKPRESKVLQIEN
jgi:hypothetical protein